MLEAIVNAVLLGRFSPSPKADKSTTCDDKIRDLREDAAKRHWEVVGEFRDDAVSGDDWDRPGLWGAMDALKKGYVLFVWDHERLARSVYLSEYLHSEAKRVGARIEFLHGQNGDSADAVMVRQILAAVAENAKKVRAANTKYRMLSKQKAGQYMGGKPPVGYQLVQKGVYIDEDGKERPQYQLGFNPEELVQIKQVKAAAERWGFGDGGTTKRLRLIGYQFRGRLINRRAVKNMLAYDGPLPPDEVLEIPTPKVMRKHVKKALGVTRDSDETFDTDKRVKNRESKRRQKENLMMLRREAAEAMRGKYA